MAFPESAHMSKRRRKEEREIHSSELCGGLTVSVPGLTDIPSLPAPRL